MSNVETVSAEIRCRADERSGQVVEIISPHDVPLGGADAMTVRRTLPRHSRSMIGAWCFVDHYGPHDVSAGGGMDVPPHPHTGLQTVSWLFAGVLEHRDSLGTHAFVRPGEVNLMTGGHGICHSEVTAPGTTILHGVQLWVALPDAHRDAPRDFQHHVPPVVDLDGATARVFLGELAGERSPVRTFSPLLGAEIVLAPGTRLTLPVDPGYEHGVLVDTGDVEVTACADAGAGPDAAGQRVAAGELGYLAAGAASLALGNPGSDPARVVLIGGEPFEENIVMWWNFIGRSHEEIAVYREAWQNQSDRFGQVEGYIGGTAWLPAPPLPETRIKPRARP
ncbi:pirin [Frankia sp. R43]|uniref:pirin family protein n=1 Tax=Frankia sp. R43 TaxID=269536 RepID=UPI0006CA5D7D|nr:pirin family protein [Frankia sp. R43]KPM56597.1 pirin [Frankia sp. R43]